MKGFEEIIQKVSAEQDLAGTQLAEEDLEEKVRQELAAQLAAHYLTEDHLTKEELEELRDEIWRQEQGHIILDGFWTNPEFIFRRQWAVMNGEWPKKENK